MPSYKIELNNKPNKGSKEFKLMLRITVYRKHSRIVLDYSILKKQFNAHSKQGNKYIRHNNSKYQTINNHIDKKIQQAKDAVESLEKEGKLISAKNIKERMALPISSNFFDFAEKLINELYKLGKLKRLDI